MCSVQQNAWMDESLMHQWIESIWKPFMDGPEKAALLLDSYTVYQKGEVVGALNDVWTDVDCCPQQV